MDTSVAVRGAWTGLSAALGVYLFLQALQASPMVKPWAAIACAATWFFLFLPSVAILVTAARAVQVAARSMLLYDLAILFLMYLATLVIQTREAALWFGLPVVGLGGLLLFEVAEARQELGHDPEAGKRAARYWIAALAAAWLIALLRTA